MAIKHAPRVISLGGGTIADEHNLEYIKGSGYLIYLRVTPEVIYDRLRESHLRPMPQTFSQEEEDQKEIVMARIRQLLGDREKYYKEADLIVDTEEKTPGEVAAQIESILKRDEK